MNMIVEQLPQSPKRMIYNAENHSFLESDSDSLLFVRGVPYPYGWIKESGSPPGPHCDCVLVSQADYALGDEVAIKIIGVFQRQMETINMWLWKQTARRRILQGLQKKSSLN